MSKAVSFLPYNSAKIRVEPQGSDERQRLPVAVWHARDQPLAARAGAMVTDHFRRDRGLLNEHQARCLKRRLLGFQRGARSRNIRAILLGGVQSFFERDLVTIVEATDRTRSNLELLRAAEPQANVIERQVRLRGDKIEQLLVMLVQRRTVMARAGLGLDAAGRHPALDPADRRRGTDVEQTCRLRRAVSFLDDRDDPLPQVFLAFAIAHPRRCRRKNRI
jgi:hypothetical protein